MENQKELVRSESDRKKQERARKGAVGSSRLTLNVNHGIPGYHLYWENDDQGKVEVRLDQGFEFVYRDEVGENRHNRSVSVSINGTLPEQRDVSDRVSRHAGVTEGGHPMKCYLLKIKEEEWQEIENSRYEGSMELEKQVRRKVGRIGMNAKGEQIDYVPGKSR